MTTFMSKPMDLTSPTHGCIYARPSRTFTILEPSVQPQPSYPVIAPQISNSVPPNMHSANRHLQPLLSPSFISPPLSLPNIQSPTPDTIFHHQSIPPLQTFCHLDNSQYHQPTLRNSPGISYITYRSVIPSSIAAPVPHAPISNLDHSFHNHSCIAPLRLISVALPIQDLCPPQYAPAVIPDAFNPPLRMLSQAHSHSHVCAPIRTPSSVTESHHSHPISPFHQVPPHMNDYDNAQHIPNNFPPPPFQVPNNNFAPPFAPPSFQIPPCFAHPPQNNFFPHPVIPALFQPPYNFIPPPAQAPLPTPRRPPALPSTKDVPKLTGKSDWGTWNMAMTTLIINQLVFGHISDDLDPGARFNPDLAPSLPPIIHRTLRLRTWMNIHIGGQWMESHHISFVRQSTWLYSTACPCLTPVSMNEGQPTTYMRSSNSITALVTTTQS